MSDVEEDLTHIVAELGDDAPAVLRMLVDIYRLGQRAGDKAGYERGYVEGSQETKSTLLKQLGAVTVGTPSYDEAGTVALTTPISQLTSLDRRVQLMLAREYSMTDTSKQMGEEGRNIPGTLADILNASPEYLQDLRGFGPSSARKLYEYLKSIGYDKSELLRII